MNGPSERSLARACYAKETSPPMRNEQESSSRTAPAVQSLSTSLASSSPPFASGASASTESRASAASACGASRRPPENAFSASFLLRASKRPELPSTAPAALAPGAYWAGPFDVERADVENGGGVWAVVRKGEAVAGGGRAVAVFRHRADALLVAATLPALASPNRLVLGERGRRLGFPVHDGQACIGHLARPEPAVLEMLRASRVLVGFPEHLALAVSSLGAEELAILGRAIQRRLTGA